MIEKIGDGYIEIDNAKVFAEKNITDSRELEVTENGTYTFVAEDYVGNLTTESITVDNIVQTISFEKPEIDPFENITLQDESVMVGTNISPIVVEDWRTGENNWRIDVSATPFTQANGSHQLPIGSLYLLALDSIVQVDGDGNMPSISYSNKRAIDDGVVTIAEGENSRGHYELVFPENALELLIDPTTAKKGNYKSTITWDVISAP